MIFAESRQAPRAVPRAALAAIAAVACVGALGLTARAAVAAFLLAVMAVLAAIDLESRVLPNRIVLPAAALVLAAQLVLFPEHAAAWILGAAGRRARACSSRTSRTRPAWAWAT